MKVFVGGLAVLLLLGCNGRVTEPEPERRVAALDLLSGFPAFVECGKEIATPLAVRALDERGLPVAGARVNFHAWLLEPSPAVLSATEVRTDEHGYAEVRVTAPPPVLRYSTFSAAAAELQVSAWVNDSVHAPSPSAHCLDLASLTLRPDTVRVAADARERAGALDADPRDSTGQRFRVIPVDFLVLDTTIVRLTDGAGSGSGRGQNRGYVPLRAGTTKVVASLLGLSDTTVVEVTAVP